MKESGVNGNNDSVVDTRNMAWRSSNVGSKLLSKMGWSDGQAVGKRQRSSLTTNTIVVTENDNDTSRVTTSTFNSEGLRVMKRQDGLGLGATAVSAAYTNATNSIQHVQDYVNVLASLQPITQPKKEKKRKRGNKEEKLSKNKKDNASTSATTTHVSRNKITHAAIRKAKFQEKSADDFKCIFGSFHSDDIISTIATKTVPSITTPSENEDDDVDSKQLRLKKKKDKKKAKPSNEFHEIKLGDN
jgi:hypothetical protein